MKAHDYKGDLETFAHYFMNNKGKRNHKSASRKKLYSWIYMFLVGYSPYFSHIFDGWERRNLPNFLFLFYEELQLVATESIYWFINFDFISN